MAAQIPEDFLDLFQKKSMAFLATRMADDTVQVTPVWCELQDGRLAVNSVKGRVKDRNMRRNSAVTLCIADPENPYRYLEVRGKVTEITEDGADPMIDRLAKRYLGQDTYPYRQPDDTRVIYRIQPEKVSVMSMG